MLPYLARSLYSDASAPPSAPPTHLGSEDSPNSHFSTSNLAGDQTKMEVVAVAAIMTYLLRLLSIRRQGIRVERYGIKK